MRARWVTILEIFNAQGQDRSTRQRQRERKTKKAAVVSISIISRLLSLFRYTLLGAPNTSYIWLRCNAAAEQNGECYLNFFVCFYFSFFFLRLLSAAKERKKKNRELEQEERARKRQAVMTTTERANDDKRGFDLTCVGCGCARRGWAKLWSHSPSV